MSHIKKKKTKETPAVSTASLPDIVFMLLFFFMVATTMREVTLKVTQEKPQATQITKVERKDLTAYIYVGKPIDEVMYGSEPRIQLDQQLASVDEIQEWVVSTRSEINEKERTKFTVSIKADGMVKMGLIQDIKEQLQEAQAYIVNYSTLRATTDDDMFENNLQR